MTDRPYPIASTILTRVTLRNRTLPEFHGRRNEQKVVHLVAPISTGNTLLTVNGRVVQEGTLAPGMLRLCNPENEEQRLIRKPLEALVFTFPLVRLERMFAGQQYEHQRDYESLTRPLLNGHRGVQQLVGSAMLAKELIGEARALFLDGISEALVGVLLDHHRQPKGTREESHKASLSAKQLRDCVAFADDRLGGKLLVSAWAEIVHLSPSEFGRRFQKSTGLTPYAWFINRRIERAGQLLRKRTTVISDLALDLGFASQSHFTEAFRRRKGMSPARWRSSQRDFDTSVVS